jgi:O-methyltransferase
VEVYFANLSRCLVAVASTQTNRGLSARMRQGLNRALGNGALRARLNRGLARANFELIVKPPTEMLEPEFERYLSRCAPFTMTSDERMYSVFQASRYLAQAAIEGDVVECGVWRAGSSMLSALTLLADEPDSQRRFWLYDTFEGMPAPGEHDVGLYGENPTAEWERNQRGDINEWCYSPLDSVRRNMLATGLSAERLVLVPGMVEETMPARLPEQIALLRLDTDWYESTRHELEHMFPRISSGGILIIDDYGHWMGVRKAVDEYLREHKIHLLLNRVDYAGRLAVKP